MFRAQESDVIEHIDSIIVIYQKPCVNSLHSLIVKSDTFCRAVCCFLINAFVIPVNERFGKLWEKS